jgi:hypothetical protein
MTKKVAIGVTVMMFLIVLLATGAEARHGRRGADGRPRGAYLGRNAQVCLRTQACRVGPPDTPAARHSPRQSAWGAVLVVLVPGWAAARHAPASAPVA